MRGFFVCILMAILTGCVSFQEKTFKLYQGQSELEVQKHLGKPKQVEGSQTSPRYVYFPDYDGYEFPFYVNFDSGKLSSWGPDQERESQARQAAQAAAARNAAIANALQGMSDQMQQ